MLSQMMRSFFGGSCGPCATLSAATPVAPTAASSDILTIRVVAFSRRRKYGFICSRRLAARSLPAVTVELLASRSCSANNKGGRIT